MDDSKKEYMKECLYKQFVRLSEIIDQKEDICEMADALTKMIEIYLLLSESNDSSVL